MTRNIGRRPVLGALAGAISVLALLGAGGPASGQEEYVMKLAHVTNPGAPRDRIMQLYGERLGERTGGRIKVEVYPSAQLGGNREVVEKVQVGAVEGTIAPTSYMGGFHPIVTVLDLPFLFPDLETASEIVNGPIVQDVLSELESQGIKAIAVYGEGAKHFVTTFPVSEPADLEGRQLRTMASPVIQAQFEAWGANPVAISFSETYNAIAQGVVEGMEQQWGLVDDLKFYEVAEHLTRSGHGFLLESFYISKIWYDSLPPDLQTAVVEEAQALVPTRLEWALDYTGNAIQSMRSKEGKDAIVYSELSEEQLERFREKAQGAYDAFIETHGSRGAELVEQIQTAVEGAD